MRRSSAVSRCTTCMAPCTPVSVRPAQMVGTVPGTPQKLASAASSVSCTVWPCGCVCQPARPSRRRPAQCDSGHRSGLGSARAARFIRRRLVQVEADGLELAVQRGRVQRRLGVSVGFLVVIATARARRSAQAMMKTSSASTAVTITSRLSVSQDGAPASRSDGFWSAALLPSGAEAPEAAAWAAPEAAPTEAAAPATPAAPAAELEPAAPAAPSFLPTRRRRCCGRSGSACRAGRASRSGGASTTRRGGGSRGTGRACRTARSSRPSGPVEPAAPAEPAAPPGPQRRQHPPIPQHRQRPSHRPVLPRPALPPPCSTRPRCPAT